MTEGEKIRCEEVIAHLLSYLDGEIDDAKRVQIDRHLDECRGCFSRAEFEKALRDKVRQAGDANPSPALQERIKALMEKF
jgi:anti-sigma factor (TIGR02949 family)